MKWKVNLWKAILNIYTSMPVFIDIFAGLAGLALINTLTAMLLMSRETCILLSKLEQLEVSKKNRCKVSHKMLLCTYTSRSDDILSKWISRSWHVFGVYYFSCVSSLLFKLTSLKLYYRTAKYTSQVWYQGTLIVFYTLPKQYLKVILLQQCRMRNFIRNCAFVLCTIGISCND